MIIQAAKRLFGLFSVFSLAFFVVSGAALAQTERGDFWFEAARDGSPIVRLHYFYSPTCPHCQRAAPFLEDLEQRLPWLKIERYSVLNNRGNALFYHDLGRQLGARTGPTPGFIYCGRVDVGYESAETTGRELEKNLIKCYEARLAGEPLELRNVTITEFPDKPKGAWLSVALPILGVVIVALFVAIRLQQRRVRRAQAEKEALRAERKARRKQEQAAARARRRSKV